MKTSMMQYRSASTVLIEQARMRLKGDKGLTPLGWVTPLSAGTLPVLRI
jgi:hypothetical protein